MLVSVFIWRIAACSSTGIYIGDKFYGRFMLTPFVLSRSFHATGYYTWFTHHNYFCNHKGQLNIYGCFCQVTVVRNTRTTTKFLVFLRMHRRMTSRRHFILWVSLQFSWSWDIPRLAHDWTIYLRWAFCESNIHWSSGYLTCPYLFISSCVMLYISEGTACGILHLLCSFVRCAVESCQRLKTYYCYYIIQTMDIVYYMAFKHIRFKNLNKLELGLKLGRYVEQWMGRSDSLVNNKVQYRNDRSSACMLSIYSVD